jgi:predicted DNA-binding WGR domain protein
MPARRFEFRSLSSNKFWEIEIIPRNNPALGAWWEVVVRFGPISAVGQRRTLSINSSVSMAEYQVRQKVQAKLRKGYREVRDAEGPSRYPRKKTKKLSKKAATPQPAVNKQPTLPTGPRKRNIIRD